MEGRAVGVGVMGKGLCLLGAESLAVGLHKTFTIGRRRMNYGEALNLNAQELVEHQGNFISSGSEKHSKPYRQKREKPADEGGMEQGGAK